MFLKGSGTKLVKFHGLRASWATIMIRKGVPAAKVMAMGGWKDLKTMEHYVSLSGMNVDGITDDLELH